MPQNIAQPPTVQRAIMNRHNQARRMNSNIAPKIEPGVGPTTHGSVNSNPSPQSRPTPTSHHSSPTSNSPSYSAQGVMTPPGSEPQMQPQRINYTLKPQMPQGMPQGSAPTTYPGQGMVPAMKGQGGDGTAGIGGVSSYYAPAPFHSHIEQLEQEYDAHTNILDDHESSGPAGPGPYPQQYASQMTQNRGRQPPQQQPQPQQVGGGPQQQIPRSGSNVPGFVPVPQPPDPYDPMIDMDPFGLSASMHFPTQFSFDTSATRSLNG